MGTRIAAHEATIKTASVEIRALTVSGRQVTLSVFRQLQEEQVVDQESLTLKGPVWGKVNYFWGDDARRTDDPLHVVWQKGDELRRALIPCDISGFSYWSKVRAMIDQSFAAASLLAIAEGQDSPDELEGRSQYGPPRFSATIEGYRTWCEFGYSGSIPAAISTIANYRQDPPTVQENPFWRGGYDKAVALLRAEAKQAYGVESFDDATKQAFTAARQLNNSKATWATLRTSLGDLDQLFIAT